ncbi:hypothetical protein OY671_008923, partial [Metschnikowia pulcherrima]
RPRAAAAGHAAQGQHRLRPQAAADRLRRHARRHHGRGAAPVPAHRRALGGAGRGRIAGAGAAAVRDPVRAMRRAPAGLRVFLRRSPRPGPDARRRRAGAVRSALPRLCAGRAGRHHRRSGPDRAAGKRDRHRARTRPVPGRGRVRVAGAAAGAMEAARGNLRSATRRRPAPEARCVAADREHSRFHGVGRSPRARAVPGHPPLHLRPFRRRQPALQPVAPGGRGSRSGGRTRRRHHRRGP